MLRRHAREIEQLAALLDGTSAPEDVGPEARRLGALATSVLEHEPFEAVALSPANRQAMRARLLADIANERTETAPVVAPVRDRAARTGRSVRVGIATGLASAVVGTTGMAFAAQQALPGDALYGVKQATESARLSLAGDLAQHGHLQLRFAEERLEEVADGAQRLGSARLVTALAEMDRRSLEGAETLVAEATRTGDGELLAQIDGFTQRQAALLVEVYDRLPPDVRPPAEDSLGVLRRIRLELLFPAMEACDCIEIAEAGVIPLSDRASLGERLRSAALPTPRPSLDLPRLTDGLTGDAAESVARVENATEASGGDDGREGLAEPGTTGTMTGRDEVGDGIGSVTEDAGGAVDDTTAGIGDTVEDTTDGLGDAIGGEVGEVVDEVGDEVGEVVEDVGDDVGDVIDDPVGKVGDVLEDPVGETSDAVDDVVDVVDGLGGILDGTTGGLGEN